MIKKKKISGIAAASVMAMILCIGTTSVFASNNDKLKKNVDAKAIASKEVRESVQTHDDLVAIATKLGINTADMSDEQIEAALVAYKLSHQENANTTKDLQAIAKKMGMDTKGMSDEQIMAAISEKGKTLEKEPTRAELEAAAKTMGIDSTGMTDKQLGAAIKNAKVNLKK
jgi:hypothetical protein